MQVTQQITRQAFIWTYILKAPFWTLYLLLVFILYKDLHASPFQVALFLSLKPAVSIFSVYWSAYVNKRRDRLIPNIVTAGVVGHLPFFFFPFVSSPWFLIVTGALYMMLNRGIIPAWMEILKINLPPSSRGKVFSLGSAISYVGGIVFPLLIGDLLDTSPGIWRWLFPGAALLSLGSLFFQLRIPIPRDNRVAAAPKPSVSLTKQIIKPWKDGWDLFKSHRSFRQFQVGFFLGGAGLMVMQPALPQFFFDALQISYTELTVAISVCKGIGFALTSRFWAHLLPKINIFRFCSFVTALALLSAAVLPLAKMQISWLYFSYVLYGVMQSGSELSWHLSGPIFAKKEDSSLFSSVNVAVVGLRGCVIPFIGSFLCTQMSASYVLLFGAFLCALATLHMSYFGKRVSAVPSPE